MTTPDERTTAVNAAISAIQHVDRVCLETLDAQARGALAAMVDDLAAIGQCDGCMGRTTHGPTPEPA